MDSRDASGSGPLEAMSTGDIRKMYRDLCKKAGKEPTRADKMGRAELLSKVSQLSGFKDKPHSTVASSVVPKMSEKLSDCFMLLDEALRMYTKREILASTGNGSSAEAKTFLSTARGLCREAACKAIDASGNGWDKGNKAFNVVDRALLRMRSDFNDELVANCVMTALLSEKHQAEMAEVRARCGR